MPVVDAATTTTEVEPFTFEPATDLEAVEPWTALAARSDNVFATREWLITWWRHFGRDRRLLLTLVRDSSGEAFALLPLYLASRAPLRVVRLLGHGATDQLGPICAVEDRPRAILALEQFVTGTAIGRWDLAIADDLPCSDQAPDQARILSRYPTHVVALADRTGDQWFADRSAKLRAQLERGERRLGRAGAVTYRVTEDRAQAPADFERFLALHDLHWSRRPGGSRSFVGREAFHRDLVPAFLDRGWLRLRFLEVDGVAVAALYSFRFRGVESHYQSGRDPAFDHCSVGLLLHRHAIRSCADEGVREYRFLRGDEPYKQRLTDRVVHQQTVAWARGPMGTVGRSAAAALPQLSRAQARWVPAAYAWGTGGSPRWGNP